MSVVVAVVLVGADLWLIWRLVRAGRTGELEMNGRVYAFRSNRVMFVTAVGGHVLGVWVVSAMIARLLGV